MTMRNLTACLLTGAISVALIPAFAVAAEPAAAAKAAAYKPPRTSDGRPELSGNWTNSTLTPEERPARYGDRLALTEAEVNELEGANNALIALGNKPTDPNATVKDLPSDCSGGRVDNCNYNAAWTDPGQTVMRVGGQPRSALLTTANGRVPTPKQPVAARPAPARPAAGAPAVRSSQNDNPEGRSLGERCILSFGRSAGPPMFDQLYNSTYQFVQTKDHLAIWVEMVHDVRIAKIGATHRTDGIRPYMGDSIARWDGDTLVVETTNIPQRQAYKGSWENLKVTERFSRTAKDRMRYQFTIEDPTMWDTPWSGEYEFGTAGPLYEYACHEGNYGLQNILAGARAEEAEAAAKTAAVGAR